jgi:hypothetical protein
MKTITMTYIEVLKKRLERKKTELNNVSELMQSEIAPNKVTNRKYVELGAEIRDLESCIDLAEVMFYESAKGSQ